jgi:PAS domain S-box-containing protein
MPKQRHFTFRNSDQKDESFEPRSILDNIDRGFIAVDENWCIVYVNAKAAADVKQQVNQLIGKNFWETFPQLKGTNTARNLHKVMKERVAFETEDYSVITGRWNQQKAYPTGNGIVVAWADLTERKKMEENLRETEERFSKIFRNNPAAMAISDINGQMMDVNESFEHLLGYTKGEILGKIGCDIGLYSPSERKQLIEQLNKNGSVSNIEMTFRHKSGKQINVLFSLEPIVLNKQKHLLGIAINITAHKKVEEALKRNDEKFKVVAEVTNMMVYEIDLTTGKVYFYRGLEQLTGFKTNENEITVSWVLNRIHPQDKKRIRKAIDEVNSGTRNSYSVRYRFMRKDGKYITVQDTARITQDSNGNPVSSIGGIIDVTEIEESRELIKLYSEKLERLVEKRTKELQDSKHLASVGLTAGMVGHDMRNPLQAIIGDLFLLRLEFNNLPEEITKQSMLESLESIEKNVEYVNKIVQDLQDYTRPIKPTIELVNLESLIKEILQKIPTNSDINYKVDIKIKGVLTDAVLLKRIITNLVNNSIQAMPSGGKLSINAFLHNERLVILIEDTGVGIPNEIKTKIFTPLFTTKAKGQGFGLAAAKRLVEALAGNITFESEVGRGTKFTVELPANQ